MINSVTSFLEKVPVYLNSSTLSPIRQAISKIGLYQLAQIAFLYQQYDSALANILCLDTLRHGTLLPAYAKIQWEGGKGREIEMEQGNRGGLGIAVKVSEQRLYVYPDYDSLATGEGITGKLFTPFMTIYYSSQAYSRSMPKAGRVLSVVQTAASAILGILSPTVKFRFTPEQRAKEFKVNVAASKDEGDGSLYTQNNIPPSHLGISGSLRQGLNRDVFKRISAHPGKFALGCAQLVAAVALTCFWCGIGVSSPLVSASYTAVSQFMEHHQTIKWIALGALHWLAI